MEHQSSTLIESGDAATGKPWRGMASVVAALALAMAVWGYFEAVRTYRPPGEWIGAEPVPEWEDDFSNVMPTLR